MLPQEPLTCQGQVGASFPAQCSVPAVLLAVSMVFRPFGAEVSAFKEKKLKLVNEKKELPPHLFFWNKLMNLDVVMGCTDYIHPTAFGASIIYMTLKWPRKRSISLDCMMGRTKNAWWSTWRRRAELAAIVKLVDPGCPKTFFSPEPSTAHIYYMLI